MTSVYCSISVHLTNLQLFMPTGVDKPKTEWRSDLCSFSRKAQRVLRMLYSIIVFVSNFFGIALDSKCLHLSITLLISSWLFMCTHTHIYRYLTHIGIFVLRPESVIRKAQVKSSESFQPYVVDTVQQVTFLQEPGAT